MCCRSCRIVTVPRITLRLGIGGQWHISKSVRTLAATSKVAHHGPSSNPHIPRILNTENNVCTCGIIPKSALFTCMFRSSDMSEYIYLQPLIRTTEMGYIYSQSFDTKYQNTFAPLQVTVGILWALRRRLHIILANSKWPPP